MNIEQLRIESLRILAQRDQIDGAAEDCMTGLQAVSDEATAADSLTQL